jgi:hypothetical protein
MSAPVETIMAYEEQVEEAWITILKNAGQENVYPEHSDATKVSPYVEVQLTSVHSTGRQHILYPDRQMWAQPFDMWTGLLMSRVVTMRGKNSDQHRPALARIRIETHMFADRFSPAILPYHQVVQLREQGLSRGFNNATSLDWSEITAEIKFWVRPEAWPVSV